MTWGEALVWWTVAFAALVAWGLLTAKFPTLARFSLTANKRLVEEYRVATGEAEQRVSPRRVRRVQIVATVLVAAVLATAFVGLLALINWLSV